MFQMKRPNQAREGIRGAVIMEMAALLPFLLLLLVGMLELCVVVHNKVVLTNASREGARYGITPLGGTATDAEIQQRVRNYAQSRLVGFPTGTETTTVVRAGSAPGSELKVQVSYPYSFLILPNLTGSAESSLTLRAQTSMRME